MKPRVSVVIRSYNRLPELCGLVAALLEQRHDAFEVVIVEQSTRRPREGVLRLAELGCDPRVRLLRLPPMGGAAARNAGVLQARGDLLVFVDDDDLPVGRDFLTRLEAPFADPRCMGVTCRHTWEGTPPISPLYRRVAARRCMRFSPLLRLPWTYARSEAPVRGVDYVHGTGGACRRELLLRAGGWDSDAPVEDETSFGIRARAVFAPGEYFAFDPGAELLRRMDVDGGLAKRHLTAGGYYRRFMTFVHRIIGRYHPWRLRILYPLYVLAGMLWTAEWIWAQSVAHRSVASRLLGSFTFLVLAPFHVLAMVAVAQGQRPGSGEALRLSRPG